MTRSGSSKISSGWQPLAGWSPTPDVLRETLDGGQAFRWTLEPGAAATPPRCLWTGNWSTHCVQLRAGGSGLQWRGTPATTSADLCRYLAHDLDWTALTNSLPWRSDAHLAHCIAAFPDLRILRQPFGETLLGFLCSATKQIVQIKQMVALLAERHGSPILSRSALRAPHSASACRLPTWPELATIPEKDLRACLLGFRARYIAETAKFLAARPGWLDETEALPYPAAKARLMELPGVGEKVADCVLLFGAGKLEAFPVDTWVLKSLARRYGLDGWKPAQVAHFGRTHFGPLAGLAQQYLFSWERKFGGR
ncbi:MAG: N-glycosylase/DNA lyase [Verrucomicrobiota bacterium]|nr:N-glycosylase/DNA lyase [Verrucomicrobiota bacterium]